METEFLPPPPTSNSEISHNGTTNPGILSKHNLHEIPGIVFLQLQPNWTMALCLKYVSSNHM
jgi:hypothetical protein